MNRLIVKLAIIVTVSALLGCERDQAATTPSTQSTAAAQASDALAKDATEMVGEAAELVVYSERKEHLIKPLFDRYTEQTGVKIRYITDNAAVLTERLVAEGENTPADLLLTVDAGNLWQAKQREILAALKSEVLHERVPTALRDPDSQWFGLAQRARTIVYSTKRVDPSQLSTYQDLADPRWQGRLCLRTSKKVYNQSLVAMMIERLGEQEAEQVVTGWVKNLAGPVLSSDSRLLEAIAAGQCDVGIVNTYYLGRILIEKPEFPVTVFWPNQGPDQGGVHVNVAGGAVVKHAPNPVAAATLLAWLASADAQQDFAGLNLEYPVNNSVPMHQLLETWGTFRSDSTNLSVAGERQRQAVQLMDRAGYR